jgi:hypothetical protein
MGETLSTGGELDGAVSTPEQQKNIIRYRFFESFF